jgi:hypothetical protein
MWWRTASKALWRDTRAFLERQRRADKPLAATIAA